MGDLTFKDAYGNEFTLDARVIARGIGPDELPWARPATRTDIEAALAENALCVVAKVGAEPTEDELSRLFNDASGDLETLVENPIAACSNARRALYRAGQHSRDEEIARLTAELNRRQRALGEALGMMHEPSTGPTWPAEWDQLIDGAQELKRAEKRAEELQAELAATKELREGDLTALSKSCNELSAALADRSELIEKMRKARRQRNEAVADAAVLRHKLAEVERERGEVRAALDRAHDCVRSRERETLEACAEIDELRAELASCRKVVEAAEAWCEWFSSRVDRIKAGAGGRYEACEMSLWQALALASAGKDSGEPLGPDGESPSEVRARCHVCQGRGRELRFGRGRVETCRSCGGTGRQAIGKDGAGSAGAAVGNEAGTEGDIASPSGFKHSAQPAPSEPAKCAHYQHKWRYLRDLNRSECTGCRELMPLGLDDADLIVECQCHWEVGDSPCRVHGEDEDEPSATVPRSEVEALRELVRVQAYVQDVDLTKWDEYNAALEKAKALLAKAEVK